MVENSLTGDPLLHLANFSIVSICVSASREITVNENYYNLQRV